MGKGHGTWEKGHGAIEKGHGAAPCLQWLGENIYGTPIFSGIGIIIKIRILLAKMWPGVFDCWILFMFEIWNFYHNGQPDLML